MKRIMCFGDSNTWGFIPGSFDFSNFYYERYDENTRWTGLLSQSLGSSYKVIEEGLNSRNTAFDDPLAPAGVILNGAKMLPTLLMTHNPLDLVILMLGTNDTKNFFNMNANMIGRGMRQLISSTKTYCAAYNTKILVVSPPVHNAGYEVYGGCFDESSKDKSAQLATVYEEICNFEACAFLDGSTVALFSDKDGIHLDETGHANMAKAITKIVLSLKL